MSRSVAPIAAALLLALAGCTTTVSTSSGPVNDARDRPSSAAAAADAVADTARRVNVRLELASAYFSRGQFSVALEEVQRALAIDANVGPAYNLRGLIQAGLGDNAAAEDSFRRALAINSRDADALQNYGWFLCQQKRYPEADVQFGAALDVPRYRDAPRTMLARGVCQQQAGRLPDAERTLARAYELDPSNPSAAFSLAQVLYQQGEYERARFYVRRINAVANQASAPTLWLAARIENKLGNRTGAQEFGQQLKDRFRDSREALAFERGQFDE